MAKVKKPQLTKEDLDARFAVRQEKNRVRRATKVTRDDIEKSLAERKAKRSERAVPGQLARIVSLGLGVALIIGSGALAVTTTASTDAFNLSTQVNEQRLASAKGDLAAIPAADEQGTATYAAELKEQIAAATAKGQEIATLQQDFTSILARGNTASNGNGAPTTAFQDSVEHRKLLAPYFVKGALLVDDAQAYVAGSVLPFDANQIDPRFPWYVGYQPGSQGRIVVDPAVSGWALTSVVATETRGVLEATWLNKNTTTGDLFAWATASYYVDPGAFGRLTVGQTTLGERNASTSSKAGE
ncbi:hypothetical protein [Cryobacterium zhongshanensis]|uniref:Uncharacterized protein n=1 Tax=Cryobacterium zhongshanensis TaxID=2928153 RepID=A0AA41UM84_9MICO|nr:hypothetical protein [Cryobacterium zhongshanensis]MCI4659586.1 hypothetical protein [Cryobacterium zhongshanensis]